MAKTLKSLSPGATLVVPGSNYNGAPPILRKLADDHHATGTTLLDTRDIIDLIAFDGKEPTNSNTNRRDNGNNNYGVSNIRKYLNSVGPNWYTPQHAQDAAPNAANIWGGYGPYDKRDGFLSAFPSRFVEQITTTTLTTILLDVDGEGVSTQKDKVFLLSMTEVGLGDEREAEGEPIQFFEYANYELTKNPTQEALDNAEQSKFAELGNWWLRTPLVDYDFLDNKSSVRVVYPYSDYGDYPAHHSTIGLSPAMNLPSDMLVSDTPNAEGHYEIILPSPIGAPKIKIGTENKEILEMYLKVDGSNKAVIETSISINGTKKPWI